MSFRNECSYLNFYKKSLKGVTEDYQISFNEDQHNIERIVPLTLDLFQQLLDSLQDKAPVHARLVAKVNFIHLNNVTQEEKERAYHFASYRSEHVDDVENFYRRHMKKIASRLDSFNVNGSNLLIKNIAHIHIQCNFTSRQRPFKLREYCRKRRTFNHASAKDTS